MRGQKRYHKTKRGTIGTTLGRASTYHSLPWVGEGLGGTGGLYCYILSGTSMPRSSMAFLMVLLTLRASLRRKIFSASVSAERML